MKKTLIQGLISVVLFFATWFVLMQVDWMTIFQVQKASDKTEEKLGELFWEGFKNSELEIKNAFVLNAVDSIVNKICIENEIDRGLIKVHILNDIEVNAFALPDGHLVIYSGLILNSDKSEELAGVIAHEMAHIQLNHVMQKLLKEIGISVLVSMTTGNGGGELVRESAKILSSTAFDRKLEKEADIKAVDYLVKAKINPELFANFLYKLSHKEHELVQYLTWISTHPESKERAKYIIEYCKGKTGETEQVLTDETWELMKLKLTD